MFKYFHPIQKAGSRLLLLVLLQVPFLGFISQAVAAPLAGTKIENQATGSFLDPIDNGVKNIESNTVQVTMIEIAGITVIPVGYGGQIAQGGSAYFDFLITNVGNDPTQFFIPGIAGVTNGTLNSIKIIEVDPDGTGSGSPLTLPSSEVNVPITGGSIGGTTGTLLTLPNGSIPVGGTVKVRVAITISPTAVIGSPVTVILGDTATNNNSASTQNQPYIASTIAGRDLYTQDNTDPSTIPNEAIGQPFNGDAAGHRQEASALQTATVTTYPSITGTVFEDVNYGGGSGRPLTVAGAIPRPNARVELYNASGAFLVSVNTDASGYYKFNLVNVPTLAQGNYFVRVVNQTVTSGRTGGCTTATGCTQIPVQTYRTKGDINNDGVADPDSERVGGEVPNSIDAGNGSAGTIMSASGAFSGNLSGQAQSISPVTIKTLTITEADFGYNFDTIVNTNNSGQGSLRQFIVNSNALGNTGLAQATARSASGQETSIFMIPDGKDHPGLVAAPSGPANQLSSYGAAVINLTSTLPIITAANTVIEGLTQTDNIGDTNATILGSGGTVGVDAVALAKFTGPEIEINGNQTTLTASGAGDQIKNIAANMHLFFSGNDSLIQDNIIGMQANGTFGSILQGSHAIEAGSGTNIAVRHNFVRANDSGIRTNGSGTGLIFELNEVDAPPSGQTDTFEGILLSNGGSGYTIRRNLIKNMRGAGTEIGFSGIPLLSTVIENNTYYRNGYVTPGGGTPSTENIGIVAYLAGAGRTVISKNIITETAGPGVVVMGSSGITITQNSTFANGIAGSSGLGIDLDPVSCDPNYYNGTNPSSPFCNHHTDGVTANDGTVGTGPTGTANNGIDYPVITSSLFSSGSLVVRGFVGNNSSGSATFAGAKLEFFIADNSPANQNGEVLLGDLKSRPHSEGKTYIGTCTADANGLFGTVAAPCSFPSISTTGLTNPLNITATATNAAGNTSEFSAAPVPSSPNILLVKRITAIEGGTNTVGGDNLAIYNDTTSPYDDNNIIIPDLPSSPTDPQRDTNKWPTLSTFLLGGTNGGTILPNTAMDYTIYFLSEGEVDAKNVILCDLIPDNQTFIPTAYNNITQIGGGLQGIDRGILVSYNGAVRSYTNVADGDGGRYYAPGETLPSACKKSPTDLIPANPNGAVVVNLNNIPTATGSGIPTDSYGFIRFRVRNR
jgi:trimeric autotransporter adhesin